MKTSVGLWDALFGKRATLELPSSTGGVKKIVGTKKWLEQMECGGKIKPLSCPTVKVNILDPLGGLTAEKFDDPADFMNALCKPRGNHRVEYWVVGEQISPVQYDKFLNLETKELYVLTNYEDGKPTTYLVLRPLWEQACEAMEK